MTGDTGIPTFGPAARPAAQAAAERMKPDPVKSEPIKSEPSKSEAVTSEPIKPDPALLRISDHERQDFVDQLTRHCAEGRITFDELDERVAKAWEARTQADLKPLAADLPSLQPAKREEPDLKKWLAEGKALLMTMPSRALIAGGAGLVLIFLLLLLFAGSHYGGPQH